MISERCPEESECEVVVKLVFEDKIATTLSIQTEVGTIASIETSGDGTVKTANFTLSGYFQNGFNGADFGVNTGLESNALPIMMARVNFLAE